MPCVRCGSPVPRSSQFCLACGTPTSTRSQTAAFGGPEVPVQAAWQPTPVNAPILLSSIVPSNYGRRVLAFLTDGAFGGVLTSIIALPILWIVAASVAPGTTFELAGLPSAQNVFNYAQRYQTGVVVARDTVLATTILSVPVLVLVAALLA
jgi:predicted permease